MINSKDKLKRNKAAIIVMVVIVILIILVFVMSACVTETSLNDPEQDTAITVTFANDVYDADIWILPQTEDNLNTSLWGTATIGKLSKGSKTDIEINDIAEDDMYIVRIIDTDQAFYSANNVLLKNGYTIHFATEDRPFDSTIDVLDKKGNMISSEHAFEGVFGAE